MNVLTPSLSPVGRPLEFLGQSVDVLKMVHLDHALLYESGGLLKHPFWTIWSEVGTLDATQQSTTHTHIWTLIFTLFPSPPPSNISLQSILCRNQLETILVDVFSKSIN